jgi:hypothetical protein
MKLMVLCGGKKKKSFNIRVCLRDRHIFFNISGMYIFISKPSDEIGLYVSEIVAGLSDILG